MNVEWRGSSEGYRVRASSAKGATDVTRLV